MKLNHKMKVFVSLATFVFLLSVLPLNTLKAAGSSGKNGDIVWYITYDTMIQQHISGDWTLTCEENVCTAEGERFYFTLLYDDNDIYSDENKLVVQWIKDFPLNWLELKAKHCDYSLEDDIYLRTVNNIEISENVESVCSNALRNLKNLKKYLYIQKILISPILELDILMKTQNLMTLQYLVIKTVLLKSMQTKKVLILFPLMERKLLLQKQKKMYQGN